MINYNQMAKEIYAQNKAVGWWDDPNRCIYQTLQLVSTEIAEATEGERKGLMDDHLPNRKMGEVELADALIRVLDLGGRYEWEYVQAGPHLGVFEVSSIAGKHLVLNETLIDLTRVYREGATASHVNECYSILIGSISVVGDIQGYDIEGAMMEKLAYNKNRADHKRANRAKEGGKAF